MKVINKIRSGSASYNETGPGSAKQQQDPDSIQIRCHLWIRVADVLKIKFDEHTDSTSAVFKRVHKIGAEKILKNAN